MKRTYSIRKLPFHTKKPKLGLFKNHILKYKQIIFNTIFWGNHKW